MIAVQIADFFILRRGESGRGAKLCNIIVWAAGFAAYRMLMKADLPIGNTLPDMLITIVLCLIVNCFYSLLIRKKRL